MATAGSSFGGGGGGEGKLDVCRLCLLPCVNEKIPVRLPCYCADCLTALVSGGQTKQRKQPPCLVTLPEELVQDVLMNLDALSLADASLSNKMLRQESKHVAKQVVEHLCLQPLFSRFVRFPELGDEPAADTSAPTSATPPSTTTAVKVGYLEMMWQLLKQLFFSFFARFLAPGDEPAVVSSAPTAAATANRVSCLEMMWRLTKKEQEVLIMGGHDGDKGPTNEVTKMIVAPNGTIRFEASTPMLQARNDFDAAYQQGEVFSISTTAGYQTSDASSIGTTERLDTLTQMKTQLAERLPNNLFDAAAVVLDDNLLVVRGQYEDANGDQVISDIVYELDEHASQADQGKWRAHAARLNTARYGAAAVAFEGKVFVCGGKDADQVALRSVESFDPATGAWQLEDDMTKKRRCFSLFVHEEELYAVGGNVDGSNTTIEKRNKATKQWEHVTDCGILRFGCASALVGSKIFLFGAYQYFYDNTFDFFDLHSKKWASDDVDGAYFDEDLDEIKAKYGGRPHGAKRFFTERSLPRRIYASKAVLITPEVAKRWTDLRLPSLKQA